MASTTAASNSSMTGAARRQMTSAIAPEDEKVTLLPFIVSDSARKQNGCKSMLWSKTTMQKSLLWRRATSHLPTTVLIVSTVVFVGCMTVMMQPSQVPTVDYNETRATWFGNRMSYEGEWEHIPVVLCATYAFVFAYGALVSLVSPKTPVLAIPAFYCAGLVLFYMWHVAAHVWESSELHRMHMIHHQVRYPREDFYGYKSLAVQQERLDRGGQPQTLFSLMNPAGSTTLSFDHEGPLLIGLGIIIIFAMSCLGTSKTTCLYALLGYAFMALFGSAVHMSFHEPGFDLEPYAWYRELRSLHMIHHMHRKNYAMVNVLIDLVFGSLLLRE